MVIPERVALRAFTRCAPSPSGCLISTYSVASHGYAQIGWTGEGMRTGTTAHRAAWVHVNGQIPDGMTVDHTCKNRPCVNVDHLRLLTNYENGRRTFGRDWPVGECVNGHPNSELIVTDGGRRIRCRICQKKHQRDYYHRNPDARAQTQRDYRARKQHRLLAA
jgi:hypothetical protein